MVSRMLSLADNDMSNLVPENSLFPRQDESKQVVLPIAKPAEEKLSIFGCRGAVAS
jgi:hypothetical protein